MPGFVADPDEPADVGVQSVISDLPRIPSDESLGLFVRELRSSTDEFCPSQTETIITEFFQAVGCVRDIYDTVDLDDYFRAVYKWFLSHLEGIQPSPHVMRRFWERYSKMSREKALYECIARLKHVRDAHAQITAEYSSAVDAFIRGDIQPNNDNYTRPYSKLVELNRDLKKFTQLSSVAVEALDIVHIYGVYWGPEWGTTPLLAEDVAEYI